MNRFTHRSFQSELLDEPGIPFEDIQRNMQELDTINRLLGGHRITISGIERLLSPSRRSVSVLEVGCGGGDNLRAIRKHFANKGFEFEFTGVDINPECIAFASSNSNNKGIRFVTSDYRHIEEKFDIIFSSLFCHHFNDDELLNLFRWKWDHCRVGFFVNDLHRHAIAWTSIGWLTKLFSKSYLVKNDAPLSVLRGFKKSELEKLMNSTGIYNFNLQWCWAFRWLLVVSKNADHEKV